MGEGYLKHPRQHKLMCDVNGNTLTTIIYQPKNKNSCVLININKRLYH